MIRSPCLVVRNFLTRKHLLGANTEKFLDKWGWLITLISIAYFSVLLSHLRATWGDICIWTCSYSVFLRTMASTIATCQNSEWFTPRQDIWSCHRMYHQNHNSKTQHSKPYSCEENPQDLLSGPASPRPWLHFLLHLPDFPASFKYVPSVIWLLNLCS